MISPTARIALALIVACAFAVAAGANPPASPTSAPVCSATMPTLPSLPDAPPAPLFKTTYDCGPCGDADCTNKNLGAFCADGAGQRLGLIVGPGTLTCGTPNLPRGAHDYECRCTLIDN